MKKSLAIIALALAGTSAFAQDLTSKKGEPILPETGDWSIGIDATPFLEYAGNFFGKTASNTAPTFNFLGNQVITGKYFIDAKTAIRANLRIGFNNSTQRSQVDDRSLSAANVPVYPTVMPTVENKWKTSNSNVGLSVGIEKRKGKTRLQGYYGGEVGFMISSSRDKFTYGNALNPVPTATTDPAVTVDPADGFTGSSNLITPPTSGVIGTGRVTDRKNGTVFAFGVRGFVGVEYFVLPKISLGGEFGWALGFATGGKTTTKIESVGNGGTPANPNIEVGNTEVKGSKQGQFHLDNDNANSFFGASGSIRLNFYF